MKDERFLEVTEAMGAAVFTEDQLYDLIYRLHPEYTPNSCVWVIGILVKNGMLSRLGFGLYRACAKPLVWAQEGALFDSISDFMAKNYPWEPYCFYSTRSLESSTGLKEAARAYFLEVPREITFPVYFGLLKALKGHLMVEPKQRELELYFSDETLIIKRLFSKSPIGKNGSPKLEKLLVDVTADPLLQHFYAAENIGDWAKANIQKYDINILTLLAYAKRRRCEDEVLAVLNDAIPEHMTKIHQRTKKGFPKEI